MAEEWQREHDRLCAAVGELVRERDRWRELGRKIAETWCGRRRLSGKPCGSPDCWPCVAQVLLVPKLSQD